MSLPTFVCLKSDYNNMYLRYRSDISVTKGLIQSSGESITDPQNQFEIVDAKNTVGLVHIKSRYNGLYLTRWSPDETWIGATATEPIEDIAKWSCTCFRPLAVEGETNKIRPVHVQLGRYPRVRDDVSVLYDLCLDALSINPHDANPVRDVFTVVDLDEFFGKSQHVAFKGDNGKYLGPATFSGLPGLQFSYDDPKDPKVSQEVFLSPDGTLRIKSNYYGKFWRLGSENLIVADGEDDPRGTNETGALFRPSLIDIGIVALLNLKNNLFVKRFSTGNRMHTLSAVGVSTNDVHTKLRVTDLDK